MRRFKIRSLDKYLARADRTRMPWVKWHSASLDDYEFGNLADAHKWHAVGLATLAALQGNDLPDDPKWLAAKINAKSKIDLEALQVAGFIVWFPSVDNLVSERHPIEVNRIEGEEKRKEKDRWSKSFERFWAVYPKKTGKQPAKKAWLKIVGTVDIQTILTALEWQTTSDQWQRGYIPNPSTYLNQERWTDEPQAPATTTPKATRTSGVSTALRLAKELHDAEERGELDNGQDNGTLPKLGRGPFGT